MHRPVRANPVAKFYYKGHHSHPVRRTVLVIESNSSHIHGYELREGSKVRQLRNAPIKSYKKSKIATEDKLGANKHRQPGPKQTTLRRTNLFELITNGA